MREAGAGDAKRWVTGPIVAIAVAAMAVGIGGCLGPGPTATTVQSPAIAHSTFLVVADPDAPASIADATTAAGVLSARLQAFGLETFGTTIDRWIQIDVGTDSASSRVRDVLAANGEVGFVALAAAEYGTSDRPGPFTAQVGAPLPTGGVALFGPEGIASAAIATDYQGRPAIIITLTPPAARAFGVHTAAHVGQFVAIVMDGRVVSAPIIQEAIMGGEVQISGGSGGALGFEETAAIVVGGALPESWRDPLVVKLIGRDEILDAVSRAHPEGGLRMASVDVVRDGSAWRPVWRVVLEGDFRECGPATSGGTGCLTAPAMEFVVDAITGEPVESRSLAE